MWPHEVHVSGLSISSGGFVHSIGVECNNSFLRIADRFDLFNWIPPDQLVNLRNEVMKQRYQVSWFHSCRQLGEVYDIHEQHLHSKFVQTPLRYATLVRSGRLCLARTVTSL